MQDVAIVRRYDRLVVSHRVDGLWEPAANWRHLERAAALEVAGRHDCGPFLYPCSPDLALRAIWEAHVDRAIQRSLFGSEVTR